MSESTKSKRSSVGTFFIAIALFIIALMFLVVIYYIFILPSAEEQLIALDKARAIPDFDNAALVYAKLLSNHKDPITFSDLTMPVNETDVKAIQNDPELGFGMDSFIESEMMNRPWQATEFPQAAKVIEIFSKHHIDTLLDAAKLEQCCFPLWRHPATIERTIYLDLITQIMCRYPRLLTAAAYLDMGEGRLDEAYSKGLILIRLGQHLRQDQVLWISIISEAMGLRLINDLLVMEDIESLDLVSLEANIGPLYDQFLEYDRNADNIHELQWQHILNHATNIDVHPTYRSHVLYCIRRGKWNQIFRYNAPDTLMSPEAAKEHSHRRNLQLITKRCRHRLLIELRRFKDENGHWPIRLDEVASKLPVEVLAEIGNSESLRLYLAGNRFVLYIPPQDGNSIAKRDLLIQDGRTLTSEEDRFLMSYLKSCFQTLITTYEKPHDSWEDDIENWFLNMGSYSVPILLNHLEQSDDNTKVASLNFLGKMADEEYLSRSRYTFFLKDLIDGYHQESASHIKEHYLGILGFFNNVSKEQQQKVDEFLKNIIYQEDSPELRTTAAMAMLRAHRLEALYMLLNHEMLQDSTRFEDVGRWHILQMIWHSLFSNYHTSWRWSDQGSTQSGYPFGGTFSGGLLKSAPEQKYVDRISKDVNEWWLKNKNKLEAVLDNDPNTEQIMRQIFPYDQP